MGGRRVWAGSLAVLLVAAGLAVVGGGSAGAEPPSASGRSDPVAGSVERTGRVWAGGVRRLAPHVRDPHERSLWCWGLNGFGQLGLGDTTDRLVPTRVGTDTDWARMSTGACSHLRGPHRPVAVVLGLERVRAARAG